MSTFVIIIVIGLIYLHLWNDYKQRKFESRRIKCVDCHEESRDSPKNYVILSNMTFCKSCFKKFEKRQQAKFYAWLAGKEVK